MNIYFKEIKAGLIMFLLWAAGLCALVFCGMTTFEGVSAGTGAVSEFLYNLALTPAAFLGMANVVVTEFPGFYTVLFFFSLTWASLYGVYLGFFAVSREDKDETYLQLAAGPRPKLTVIRSRILAAFTYLVLFTALFIVFSLLAIKRLDMGIVFSNETVLFSLSMLFVSSMYAAISAFIRAVIKKAGKTALAGYLMFLATFLMGGLIDTMEEPGSLRFLSPLKYYRPQDLLDFKPDVRYTVFLVGFSWILLIFVFRDRDPRSPPGTAKK